MTVYDGYLRNGSAALRGRSHLIVEMVINDQKCRDRDWRCCSGKRMRHPLLGNAAGDQFRHLKAAQAAGCLALESDLARRRPAAVGLAAQGRSGVRQSGERTDRLRARVHRSAAHCPGAGWSSGDEVARRGLAYRHRHPGHSVLSRPSAISQLWFGHRTGCGGVGNS